MVDTRTFDESFTGNTSKMEAISAQLIFLFDQKCFGSQLSGAGCDRQSSGTTADDADIYLTFTDGALATDATPNLTYAAGTLADLATIVALTSGPTATTDLAPPVLLIASSTIGATTVTAIFSEPVDTSNIGPGDLVTGDFAYGDVAAGGGHPAPLDVDRDRPDLEHAVALQRRTAQPREHDLATGWPGADGGVVVSRLQCGSRRADRCRSPASSSAGKRPRGEGGGVRPQESPRR